jgi:cytochrome c5
MKKMCVYLACAAMVLGMAGSASAERSGREVYESKCRVCHASGVAGAPKYGDKAWAELAKKGMKELLGVSIKGKGSMPARGLCADCSDGELKAAIQYMIDSAK